jgi:hypothetical protein
MSDKNTNYIYYFNFLILRREIVLNLSNWISKEMLKTILFLFFSQCGSLCLAQSDSITKSPDNHYNIKLSYNSSVIYPGISTGIEFPLLQVKNKGLIIRKNSRSYFKSRFISGNLSWYHHPEFHDNIYITSEWVRRRTRSGGFISEFSLGPGFSRTFLSGTTYRVNKNGEVSTVRKAGYNYAMVTIGGGFGYDFSMNKKLPLSVFSKMNIISMFPYNSTIYFRPVLELGIRYETGRSGINILRNHKMNTL